MRRYFVPSNGAVYYKSLHNGAFYYIWCLGLKWGNSITPHFGPRSQLAKSLHTIQSPLYLWPPILYTPRIPQPWIVMTSNEDTLRIEVDSPPLNLDCDGVSVDEPEEVADGNLSTVFV